MALLVKTLFFLLQLLPVRLLGGIGAGIGRIAYVIDKRHRNIALNNLARIYPDRDMSWRIRIAHESFAELGRTMFEMPHVFMRSKDFLLSRITVNGLDEFRAEAARGHGVMATAMHHSNWELGALSFSMLDIESEMIYRTVRQPALDHFMLDARSRFGATLHARNESMRWLPKAIKKGHTIAVMIDQHLSNGTPIPFLGHLANTTTMPAAFAARYGMPLFAVTLDRIDRSFRFELNLRKITLPEGGSETECMETICKALTPAIEKRPELWLWIHRRWLYLDEQEAAA